MLLVCDRWLLRPRHSHMDQVSTTSHCTGGAWDLSPSLPPRFGHAATSAPCVPLLAPAPRRSLPTCCRVFSLPDACTPRHHVELCLDCTLLTGDRRSVPLPQLAQVRVLHLLGLEPDADDRVPRPERCGQRVQPAVGLVHRRRREWAAARRGALPRSRPWSRPWPKLTLSGVRRATHP